VCTALLYLRWDARARRLSWPFLTFFTPRLGPPRVEQGEFAASVLSPALLSTAKLLELALIVA
jgi:hypothetical protein